MNHHSHQSENPGCFCKCRERRPSIISPEQNKVYTTDTLVIRGMGEPCQTIVIRLNNIAHRNCVHESGRWYLSPSDFTDLKQGENTVTVFLIDECGERSDPVSVTFYLQPPTPVILSPVSGQTVTASPLTVSGSATPGNTVTVTFDNATYSVLVAADGTWSVPVVLSTPGAKVISAVQSGNGYPPSAAATVAITYALVLAPPPDTLITLPLQAQQAAQTQQTLQEQSIRQTRTINRTITRAAQNRLSVAFDVANGAHFRDREIDLTGTATPLSDIDIRVDGRSLNAKADEQGRFAFTTHALNPGAHQVRATARRATATSPTATINLIIDAPGKAPAQAPTQAPIKTPLIIAPVANSRITAQPFLIAGRAEPSSSLVTKIGDLKFIAQASKSGTWTLNASGVSKGGQTITAVQTGPNGAESPKATRTITIL